LAVDRRIEESFQITDNIQVFVNDVEGLLVRLGIDAPREVRIVRAELEPLEVDLRGQNREAQVDAAVASRDQRNSSA